MRGKGRPHLMQRLRLGITPACAGKSQIIHAIAAFDRDHPRVCGEKLDALASIADAVGSPPRVRGKATRLRADRYAGRITPACAGKSANNVETYTLSEDPPRVCGEKSENSKYSSSIEGSPPRVRGKGGQSKRISRALRITPACAGKRLSRTAYIALIRDHPRVCGEKSNTRSACSRQ